MTGPEQPSLDDALKASAGPARPPNPGPAENDLTEGRRLRDVGMAQAMNAAVPWDIIAIDKAIAQLAATGRRFTANDTRALLPEVRRTAIGGRFNYAHRRGLIEKTGQYVQSNDPGTHAHPITEWQGVVLGADIPRDGAA